jgi:three-Cys-motif partner protein
LLELSDEFSIAAQDDGLCHEEVGSWVEDKHRLVALYDSLFATGMKKKWNARVYIDLYSGSGLVRVRDTRKFLWGSPILALMTKDPFDRYIFCESNAESIDALQTRVHRLFPDADVSFVPGDCNQLVEEICAFIPRASKSFRVLSFCFVDPFDLSIKFSTVRRLAAHYMDFLFLLALHMDANRNEANYTDPRNRKIDNFLDVSDWRERWANRPRRLSFAQFLAEEYARRMETLDYLPQPFHRMKQVRSDVRNLPLYHLALFSRNRLAYDYWKQVLKYSTAQQSLWE